MEPSREHLGRAAFNAFYELVPGPHLEAWDKLSPTGRDMWMCAAKAVVDACQ